MDIKIRYVTPRVRWRQATLNFFMQESEGRGGQIRFRSGQLGLLAGARQRGGRLRQVLAVQEGGGKKQCSFPHIIHIKDLLKQHALRDLGDTFVAEVEEEGGEIVACVRIVLREEEAGRVAVVGPLAVSPERKVWWFCREIVREIGVSHTLCEIAHLWSQSLRLCVVWEIDIDRKKAR